MQALMIAAPMLGLIGLGVAGVGLFGRDRSADEHDVSDYQPALAPARRNWPLVDRKPIVLGPGMTVTPIADDILPPAPAGMDAGTPLWRELTVATAVPTLSDDEVREKAAAILRELGEQAHAELAGAR